MSDLSSESSNKKKPLGRGLGSLLGSQNSMDIDNSQPSSPAGPGKNALNSARPMASQMATQGLSSPGQSAQQPHIPNESRIWQIAIDKIRPSPYQPRTLFEKDKLSELSQSIKTSGILQPITARKLANGSFEIIAGERRWRAAQLAGLHEVPVLLKTLGDRETLELALIENVQREDLNPIEEADAYQRLAKEFNLTQQQVAEKVGKDRATVANAIRLLQLPLEIRDMVSAEQISVGHAKVLLALPNSSDQTQWAKKVRDQNLTVRILEKEVQKILVPAKKATTSALDENVTQRLIAGLSDELQKRLGTKVSIDYLNSKGKISIHFYSDEELTQIVERMKK